MTLKRLLLSALAATFAFPTLLNADEITMTGGRKVQGVIVRESSSSVTILTANGRKKRIRASRIEMTEENFKIGVEQIDARTKDLDGRDADGLMKVAKWAQGEKIRGHELLAHFALRIDSQHKAAHEHLGHHFAIDKWFEDKKKAEKYRDEVLGEELEAEGYVKYRGGWIKKDDRTRFNRDKDAFMQDERGIWRDKAELMRERGFTLVSGEWVKMTADDREAAEKFKKLVGDDIIPITSEHFQIFTMQYPPSKAQEFSDLAERAYQWWLEKVGKPKGHDLFGGRKGTIWIFKDFTSAQEWYKHYASRYGVDTDSFRKSFMRGQGRVLSAGRLIGLVNIENLNRDPLNQVANYAAHFCAVYYARGLSGGSWFTSAVGNHCEHELLGNGIITYTTNTKYGGNTGIANKEFDTKGSPDVLVGLIRDGNYDGFATLMRKGLNALDGRDLARGWSIVKWLFDEHREKFIEWMNLSNQMEPVEALQKVFGWTPDQLDDAWEKHMEKR